MDLSADVAAIVAQAPEWNFAGDCALLDLMKRISQNLEEHGERTSRKLNEFETNVRRVDIELDNATNSLRSLQFGQQFVEYRVEEVDDDDFAVPDEQKKKPKVETKSSQTMAKEFLQNNLEMFRKNFEPMDIEVPDSDDEDGTVNVTTVFRAKNPYDAVPLPYVMGTKKWQEHKYAGLYDSAENSEDEQPEQFSSSSSDEQEVPAQKATPMPQRMEMPQSDSSSIASLPRDPPVVAPPAPATLQPPNPTVVEAAPRTKAQPRPIISSQRNPHEHNFAALRESPPSDDPPSTSSSLNSSAAAGGLPRVDASLSSSSSSASKPVPAVRRQTPPKLFDEDITISAAPPAPAAVPIPIDIPVPENEVKPVAVASQIKRKPVNLFNDDEFHSFMSEIVDKVQCKSGNSVKSPERIEETPKKTVEEPPKQRQTVPKATEPPQRKLNLFDDSPPVSPVPKPVAVAATPSKVPPKTLFDDNLDDDVDDFLSSFTPKAKPAQQQQPPKTSLFDDDDDDLDIDDIFAKKTPTANKLSNKFVGKTSLFDDDDEEDNANDIFATTSKAKVVSKQQPEVATVEPPNVQRKSLFDDLGDDDLFGTPKSNKNVFADEQKQDVQRTLGQFVEKEEPPVDTPQLKQQTEKIVRDEPQQLAPQAEIIPARKPKLTKPKANLFSDDFSDEEEPVEVSIRDTATSEKPKEIIAEAQPSAPAKPANKVEEEKVIRQEEKEVIDNLQPKDSSNLKEAAPERVPSPAAQEEATRTTEKEVVETEPAASSVAQETAHLAAKEEVPSSIKEEVPSSTKEQTPPSAEEEAPPAAEQEAAPAESDDEEDPILTMVADLSSKQKQLQSEGETAVPQPQIMQMFFDEPPDDSEFFQSLGTSSLNSLSASKMFDSAHDFFEPSLPDLPKATPSSSSAAAAEQQAGNEYGGLRLFSDVPPDDDDDDDDDTPQQSKAMPGNASTKRIHTIFYDDFSETARAGAAEQTKMPPSKLPIFDEEPPVDVVDKSIASQPELPSSPVKKLQMPNIQINVHALLPGAAGRPKFAKKQEEDQEKEQEEQEQEMPKQEEDDQLKASVIPSKTVSNDTENILQCLGKTRTRGPARRPSTRRARRENYAKALLEEQSVTPTEQTSEVAPQKTSQPVIAAVVKETPSFLDGNDDEEDALFAAAKPPAKETPKEYLKVTKQLPAVSAAPVPVALLPSQPPEDKVKSKSAASFLNSDEDDESDALFSPARTQQTQQSKPVVSFLDGDVETVTPATSAAPASTVNAQQAAPTPVSFVSQKPPEDVFKPRVSSFLDSDEDDDDALFGAVRKSVPASPSVPATVVPSNSSGAGAVSTPSTAAPTPAVVNKSQQKVPAKVVSFLDTDDEDDDALFSPVRRTGTAAPAVAEVAATKVSVSNPAPATTRAPAAVSAPTAARAPATVPAPAAVSTLPSTPAALPALISNPVKPKASKLFDDSDDDDDLFGTPCAPVLKTKSTPAVATPKSAPAPVTAPVAAASSSLFASDSEEEQKPTPKATTTSRAKQPAKSLFSDDEDDDDLFGSGAGAATKRAAPRPQVKSIQAPKPKVAASVKITTTMPKPSAGTADNPLADLLDP